MKGRVLFIVLVVAFVALVPTVYYLLFEYGLSVSSPVGGGTLPKPPQNLRVAQLAPDGTIPVALSLTQINGKVEIERGAGKWQAAEEGMLLGSHDRIRTDPRAHAVLAMPGVFSVELDSGSDFQIKSLAENISHFMLEEGMISADVVENPAKRFEVTASSTLASTTGAVFKMGVNPEGLVAVGTKTGAVNVASKGKVVKVSEGYLARVERGKTPEDPIRIPRELFLKVRWPERRELSSNKLAIVGKTRPGARVRVNGATVVVDARGKFRKLLSLREGVNRIKVESYDVGGNNRLVDSPSYEVDTRPDAFQIQTSPRMWEKKNKPE